MFLAPLVPAPLVPAPLVPAFGVPKRIQRVTLSLVGVWAEVWAEVLAGWLNGVWAEVRAELWVGWLNGVRAVRVERGVRFGFGVPVND